jgi:hypothetical protein
LAAKLPGLRGYRNSVDVAAGEGESPYYCVFEAHFDDAAAYSAALESTVGQAGARMSRPLRAARVAIVPMHGMPRIRPSGAPACR